MNRFIISSLAAVFAAAALSSSAVGQTYTWNGTSSSMNLNTNWAGNATPTSGDPSLKLVFTGGYSTANQNIATPLVLQDLEVNGYHEFNGNQIQFDNLGANPTLTGTSPNAYFYGPLDFNAPTTLNGAGGGFYFYGALTGNDLTFGATGNTYYRIQGSGTSLGGVNTVSAGAQLDVFETAALGGTLNVAGGYVYLATNNVLAAGADVNVSANGQLIQGGATTINDLDVSGGTVYTGGGLTVTGMISSSSGANVIGNGGSVALGAATTIDVTSGGADQLNINALITTGSFDKTGSGKLVLGTFGTNTFSGTNTVTAGTLRGTAAAIGTVVNNGVIELDGGTLNSVQISGPGDVIVTGGTATYNTAQAYAGTTTLDGGGISGFVSTLPALITGAGSGGYVTFLETVDVTHTGMLAGTVGVNKYTTGVLTLNGNNPYSVGTFVSAGGLAIGADTAIGTGQLGVYAAASTLEAIGSRTLANSLYIGGGVTFEGAGDFNFTDATAKSLTSSTITHNSTGSTTIAGKFSVSPGAQLVVNDGSLALGDAGIVNGFTSAGPVVVNGGTLSLNSLNFINLPTVTLAGGTLNVPNGYAIPLGAVLQGNGGVTGRLATANGSTIIANGNLALGDSAHPAGVNFDGEIYTGANTVTLLDSNQAVLGSITDVGTPSTNGAISAPNGLVLNFGRNIVGRGQIQSTNALAQAVIVNGDVNGDSIANFLEFTGFVKGVGTFNNVAFSGTFSPGLSPTLMTIGNAILMPSNVLDIEIGGLNRGSQYDAFDITGALALGGMLKATLFNSFNPSLGDQFLLFQGIGSGTFPGAFSGFDYSLAPLAPGLAWDDSLLYSNGILRVVAAVPEPGTLVLTAFMVGAALVWRRRSLPGAAS